MTSDETGYVKDLFAREDELLVELRAAMDARGLPSIQVPATTGRLLQLLVAACGGRTVLEIGTLGGYSAVWMARALPEGARLISLEKEEEHAELAREFTERAGVGDRVEIRRGLAADLLPEVGPDGSFDVVFIDADKESYPLYLEHAKRLLRVGGLVLADNALWKGKVADPAEDDDLTRALRAFNRELAESPDFLATVVPVGDGVAVGVKRPAAGT